MKLHDFGLWFKLWNTPDGDEWSTTIPPKDIFDFYFDGEKIGHNFFDNILSIYPETRHIIKLRCEYRLDDIDCRYMDIGRRITLDDFEIIENPDYKGIK